MKGVQIIKNMATCSEDVAIDDNKIDNTMSGFLVAGVKKQFNEPSKLS